MSNRALFEQLDPKDGLKDGLTFAKNTILLVEDTFPDYILGGMWNAWVVDEQGEKTSKGKIPSKIA